MFFKVFWDFDSGKHRMDNTCLFRFPFERFALTDGKRRERNFT